MVTDLRARLRIVPAHDSLVMRAAQIKAGGGLSYADAFAAATALGIGAPLVTGDPELRALVRRLPALRLEWIGG